MFGESADTAIARASVRLYRAAVQNSQLFVSGSKAAISAPNLSWRRRPGLPRMGPRPPPTSRRPRYHVMAWQMRIVGLKGGGGNILKSRVSNAIRGNSKSPKDALRQAPSYRGASSMARFFSAPGAAGKHAGPPFGAMPGSRAVPRRLGHWRRAHHGSAPAPTPVSKPMERTPIARSDRPQRMAGNAARGPKIRYSDPPARCGRCLPRQSHPVGGTDRGFSRQRAARPAIISPRFSIMSRRRRTAHPCKASLPARQGLERRTDRAARTRQSLSGMFDPSGCLALFRAWPISAGRNTWLFRDE